MADYENIVRLAVDTYNGRQMKYSKEDSLETLRKALVDINGGTAFDIKKMRDGASNGLYAIVETILEQTAAQGLQEDDFFMNLVEYKNVAEGDKNEFVTEDNDLFVVADAAKGIRGVRRQRLGGATTVSLPTTFKTVRIYEELSRLLSGRTDMNKFIDRVGRSFRQKLLDDVYTVWSSIVADQIGGNNYFPVAGAYDEATLLKTIEHVEAAAGGRPATIIGTKTAVRTLAPSIQGSDSKNDLYNMGYYGNFYGTNVVALPQRHKVGTTDFVFDNDVLTIVAGDDKPIKVVREGNGIIIPRNAADNNDLTQEYIYGENYGVGLVMAGGNSGIGKYKFTS